MRIYFSARKTGRFDSRSEPNVILIRFRRLQKSTQRPFLQRKTGSADGQGLRGRGKVHRRGHGEGLLP